MTDFLCKFWNFASLDLRWILGCCGRADLRRRECRRGMGIDPDCYIDDSDQKHNKNQALQPRTACPGGWVVAAHIARAKFRLVFAKHVIKLATYANAKRRFKEKQKQACATHQHVDRANHTFDDYQVHHQQGQCESNSPCKSFLWSAHILWFLSPNDPLTQYQTG